MWTFKHVYEKTVHFYSQQERMCFLGGYSQHCEDILLSVETYSLNSVKFWCLYFVFHIYSDHIGLMIKIDVQCVSGGFWNWSLQRPCLFRLRYCNAIIGLLGHKSRCQVGLQHAQRSVVSAYTHQYRYFWETKAIYFKTIALNCSCLEVYGLNY